MSSTQGRPRSRDADGLDAGDRRLSVAMVQCPHDGVEHRVQLLAHVLGQKPQNEIAVLLQQLVLASIAPVGDRIGEMLRAIQLHGDTRLSAQEIDFQRPEAIERDRQRGVQLETPFVSGKVSRRR